MKIDQINCTIDFRRQEVKASSLNGIDYLEVYLSQSPIDNSFQALLLVFCLKPVGPINQVDPSTHLPQQNLIITGGVRRPNIKAKWANTADKVPTSPYPPDFSSIDKEALNSIASRGITPDKVIVVRTDDGDFSTYTIRLVDSSNNYLPFDNFDERLSQIDFTFKIECEGNFDCKQKKTCPPQVFDEPILDYMAKDYTSFRQLMLDRIRLINPTWTETHSADQGIMLIELLAYVADQLSYYQDAVTTQGYLGTATRRIPVRRIARLVDYKVNDGSNARAWICFTVVPSSGAEGYLLKNGTPLFTGGSDGNPIVSPDNFNKDLSADKKVFETMYDITLLSAMNQLNFYPWSGSNCYLPSGSTNATLVNQNGNLYSNKLFCWNPFTDSDKQSLVNFLQDNFGWTWIREDLVSMTDQQTITIQAPNGSCLIVLDTGRNIATLTYQNWTYEFKIITDKNGNLNAYSLALEVGDVLLFEEIRAVSSPTVEGDSRHRQAVSLVNVMARTDDVTGKQIVDIQWHQDDALGFSMCLYKDNDVANPVGIARGNVVLADHGQTVKGENLNQSDPVFNIQTNSKINFAHRFYPKLANKPLTFAGPPFGNLAVTQGGTVQSAMSAIQYDKSKVLPSIQIIDSNSDIWSVRPDLFESSESAKDFVVEMEDDGSTYCRFGDGNFGVIPYPTKNNQYSATYRFGNGSSGNVGAESITKVVLSDIQSGILSVRNPLAAQGGTDPETLDEVRQYAPQAFRTQMRAVTMDDYTEILKRCPDVQNARASLVWTGSWYTVFVAVDRKDGVAVDETFKSEITNYLWQYRLAGYDIEVTQPSYAALEIILHVCVAQNYFQDKVRQQLLQVFTNQLLDTGQPGFFYPDNFSFGQPLYLSQIYDVAMKVDGVCSVDIVKFHRLGSTNDNELVNGVFKPAPYEIIRVDNDPNDPEKGRIDFEMDGGL